MSIFTKSLIMTFQKKNWGWIGGIPGIITVGAYLQTFNPLKWWENLAILGVSLCIFFALFYIFYFLRNAYGWIHNVKVESTWGEIVTGLADVYANIHEIERKDTISEKDVADALSTFCNKVKALFDKKTKSNCCVSIKVPVSNYLDSGEWNSIQVKNVARDKKHILERDTDEYKAANHDILGNTAYSRVISLVLKESSKPHIYLNNDVDPTRDSNYATTSPEDNERKAIPYKSELVVPIIPTKYGKLNEVLFGGFLCIDSDKQDAFDADHYDVAMTQGLADGLYNLMLRLLELQKKNNF